MLRLFVFFVITWVLATGPFLYSKFFFTDNWVISSFIFGSGNALCVVLILMASEHINKKYRISILNISLPVFYFLAATILLVTAVFESKSEPLVFEVAVPIIFILCPVSTFIHEVLPISEVLTIPLSILFGGLFYYFLQQKFLKWGRITGKWEGKDQK